MSDNGLPIGAARRRSIQEDEAVPSTDASPHRLHSGSGAVARKAHEVAAAFADQVSPVFVATVHPERAFASTPQLAIEIFRLKAERPTATDAAVRAGIDARVKQLSSEWCERSSASGSKPPSATFDPRRATDAELNNALLWTEVGNCFPSGTVDHPASANAYREALIFEWTLRTPGAVDRIVSANPYAEGVRSLVEADLLRLGDKTPCRTNETTQALVNRRLELIGAMALKEAGENAARLTMGLDGKVGRSEDVIDYKKEQFIRALNPGTTTGALLAGAVGLRGGGIDEMRAGGAAGNLLETASGKSAVPTEYGERLPVEGNRGAGAR